MLVHVAVKFDFNNLNRMLSQLYNRRPPLKAQAEETKQEVDVINSFYEERKSRSISAKQHNLLKKNISFFNQEE